MEQSASFSLGTYFDDFVEKSIAEGRYKDASEIIRAGLRLLEQEENRTTVLKAAIREGIDSGIMVDFNSTTHLQALKAKKANG